MPEHDPDYSVRWSKIKEQFTRSYLANGGDEGRNSHNRLRRRQQAVWQHRIWEHYCRDEDDLASDLRNGVSKGEVSKDASDGIPQLRPMNIDREGRVVLTGMKYVPENLGPDVRGGDVIFNNTNSRELVGKAAAVDGDTEYAISRHMTRVLPPEGLSHRFVAFQLHYL